MRRPPLLACLLALSVLPAACGGGDDAGLIRTDRADALLAALDDVETRVAAGECGRAAAAFDELRARAAGLPDRTDARLRARIEEGVQGLERQAADECRETEPTTTTEEEAPPETVEEVPTEPVEPAPTTTEEEPPPTTTDEEPPDEPAPTPSPDPPPNPPGNPNPPGGGAVGPDDSGGTIAP